VRRKERCYLDVPTKSDVGVFQAFEVDRSDEPEASAVGQMVATHTAAFVRGDPVEGDAHGGDPVEDFYFGVFDVVAYPAWVIVLRMRIIGEDRSFSSLQNQFLS
jgi:hypothetical protein